MERFKRQTARAIPLPEANIDTDVIFPARFLLITAKRGLGRYAFHEWRYGPGGRLRALVSEQLSVAFDAELASITIRGTPYTHVRFNFPKGNGTGP